MRVTAVRTALDLKGGERPQDVSDSDLPDRMLGPVGVDVELDILRQLHRDDFADAFRQALASLEPRDRMLLGLHWLDGVPATRLGEMYGVHRITVGRWLEEAQERVLTGTRANLADRLGVSPDEADSLIRLLRSRLDVSMRALRERD
jgi:RNA polymerase sigma-70 factor (ECF subfamily)